MHRAGTGVYYMNSLVLHWRKCLASKHGNICFSLRAWKLFSSFIFIHYLLQVAYSDRATIIFITETQQALVVAALHSKQHKS